MEATWRGLVCAIALGMIFSIIAPVSAYPLEGGGPWGGGGEGDGDDNPDLPTVPAIGYWTVDSPGASYFGWLDSSTANFYNPIGVRERTGPIGNMWNTNFTDDNLWIWGGYYLDMAYAYGWPYQTMPWLNASIGYVNLVAVVQPAFVVGVPVNYNTYIQYSLDSGDTWEPAQGAGTITVMASSTSLTEYTYNVTTNETWTPEMLLSSQTFVRLFTDSPIGPVNKFTFDYVGLRYTWNWSGYEPPAKGPSWKNSTFGKLGAEGWFSGGLGMIGFIGMIATPAAGYVVAKNSDNRMATAIKFLMVFMLCFALFLGSIM